MHRSRRLEDDLTPTELSRAVAAAAATGAVDLTVSNPTKVGLDYPEAELRAALSLPEVIRYEPAPLGLPAARAAIAAEVGCDPDDVIVTASTSESYALLFKLLGDPGDRVAVPVPSYPLLAHLGRLEGIEVEPYRLTYDGRWRLDPGEVEASLRGGARAVVSVAPNNPTGSCPSPDELAQLRRTCAEHDVPLISDEVFRTYGFGATPLPSAAGDDHGPLTIVLDGLSKRAALPQLKLGWMQLSGPPAQRAAVRAALEVLCDAYLSVGAPVQLGVGALLTAGAGIALQLRGRAQRNREALRAALVARPEVSLLRADGGWSSALRLPRVRSDAEWVLHLAQAHGVIVQPGFWYDFEQEAHLVLSLIAAPEVFDRGLARLMAGFGSGLGS